MTRAKVGRTLRGKVGLLLIGALAACGGDPPPWDPTLAATTTTFAARRGLRVARGEIHLHSPYSHDACDGHGLPDGQPDPTCLTDLRAGVCTTHQDFAMLTDHADFMAQQDWDALFLPQAGDEAVMQDGQHVASRLACPDGTSVLAMVGSENDLMPIGLHEHVAATADERRAILKGTDAASADAFRAHGALVAVAHGESHSVDQLMAVDADATEIYNLHANIGPDIRADMGLDPLAPINALLPFVTGEDTSLTPDLAMLLFWEENPLELGRLEAMWSAGRRPLGTVGVDAHENAVSGKMSDGERGDGYRRVMRWFSNHLLVTDVTPAALVDAIDHGRGYGAFEVFGPPVGFDFRAEQAGAVTEIGGTAPAGADLVLEPPHDDQISDDDVRLRILRVADGASTEVAAGTGRAPLRVPSATPGVYRAEVRVTPRGFRRFLGSAADVAQHEFVWVYANPIYVE